MVWAFVACNPIPQNGHPLQPPTTLSYPSNTPGSFPSSQFKSPIFVPTLEVDLSPSPIADTPTDSFDIQSFYPLALGNTWVYSATYYGYHITGERESPIISVITTTFLITDQVISTHIQVPYFAAQLKRTAHIVSGVDLDKYPQPPLEAHPATEALISKHNLDWAIVNPSTRIYCILSIFRGSFHHRDPEDPEFFIFSQGSLCLRGEHNRNAMVPPTY